MTKLVSIAGQDPQVTTASRDDDLAVYVGRQPIFDRQRQVAGYELLFRSASDRDKAIFVDGDAATSQVILNTFISIGIDDVAGNVPVYINMTRPFLVEGWAAQLPADRVVLEILQDVPVDDELLAAAKGLRDQGYRLALDNFILDPSKEPLLKLAETVKVDLRSIDKSTLAEHVALLRARAPTLLVQKVETEEDYHRCSDAGFDLFQGYFFAKPKLLGGRRLKSNKLAALQLLTKLRNPATPLREVERLVTQDVSLSYKLLRVVNSAAVGLPREIESVRRAIVMLGRQRIGAWVSLISFAELGDESELMRTAMVRGRMCENLAPHCGMVEEADAFFTVGLFSALEALLGLPMARIVESLPLARPLCNALMLRDGPMGQALACTLLYEQGKDRLVAQTAKRCGFGPTVARDAYLEALRWANEAVRTIEDE